MQPDSALGDTFWHSVSQEGLAQGDYLTDCPVPIFPADYGKPGLSSTVDIRRADLIVVSQSCDLENGNVQLVALCPIFTVATLKASDPKYTTPAMLEEIRSGKRFALHMLSSPTNLADNTDVRIVDFREIHSLPVDYLRRHAHNLGARWRLKSPYLEHFSQGFARFFMRVGLPSAIPKFK